MNEQTKSRRIKKIRIQMIAGFTALILLLIFLIIMIFNVRMSHSMKNQTADTIEHLNSQVASNVNSYFENISSNVNKVYSDETIFKCDRERLKSNTGYRTELSERVDSYSVLSFYEDFAVVYSDGTVLGRLSDTTLEQYQDTQSLFTAINSVLPIKAAGVWVNDLVENHSMLSYVKLMDSDSVFIASVKAETIESTFSNAVYVEGMNIYLVNSSLVIQCSTDGSIGPGSYLKTQIYRLVDRNNNHTQIGDQYVVANNKLDNGWIVVTAVPSIQVLEPLREAMGYVVLVACFVGIIAIGFIYMMSTTITRVIEQTVDKLDVKAHTDLLTGLVNKRSFEELVEMTLENPEPNMSYALVFMDVDNFKGVNDKCGHDIGDEVLRSFAHTVGAVFREGDIKGRLGGDEFCVLMKIPMADKEVMMGTVNDVCKRFRDALHRKATSARQSLPAVTSSMGAAMWDGAPEGFSHLYHKADVAVYASKKKGKDTWSVYGQDDVNESIIKEDK